MGEDVARAGLEGRHGVLRPGRAGRAARGARLPPRRLRLHDLHRQLRPAAGGDLRRRSAPRTSRSSRCCRGNRNFEGRINPDVKMNYLASPPLCVAYALAGTMDIDLLDEPLGPGRGRRGRLPQGHLADRARRSRDVVEEAVRVGHVPHVLRRGVRGRRALELARGARGRPLRLGRGLDLRAPAAVLRGRARASRSARRATSRARACWPLLGDSRHHRPHLARRRDQEGLARRRSTSTSTASSSKDFNSYGSRRGNHEVMVRGTFANIRLRNQLAPGTEGGVTLHHAGRRGDDDLRRGDAVRRGRHAAGRARRQGVRLGLVARLGGQGHEPARRARGDRASPSSASTAPTWSAWACCRCSSPTARTPSRSG